VDLTSAAGQSARTLQTGLTKRQGLLMAQAGENHTPTDKLSDEDWQVIKKHLPAGADQALARSELERIMRDKATPKQKRLECLCLVEQLRPSINALLKTGSEEDQAFAKQLRQRVGKAEKEAEFYGHIPNDTKFKRHCEIFRLYSRLGGDLGVSTGRNERGQYRRWRPPHGAVIEFFQAASLAVFSKAPKPDQVKKIIRRYRQLHFQYGAAHIGGKSESKSTFHSDALVVSKPK
jgi:hypothetical protein